MSFIGKIKSRLKRITGSVEEGVLEIEDPMMEFGQVIVDRVSEITNIRFVRDDKLKFWYSRGSTLYEVVLGLNKIGFAYARNHGPLDLACFTSPKESLSVIVWGNSERKWVALRFIP